LATESKVMLDNVFPFIIEKLSSAETKTKFECLELLDEMIGTFKHTAELKEHFAVSISSTMNEFFNRFETEIQ